MPTAKSAAGVFSDGGGGSLVASVIGPGNALMCQNTHRRVDHSQPGPPRQGPLELHHVGKDQHDRPLIRPSAAGLPTPRSHSPPSLGYFPEPPSDVQYLASYRPVRHHLPTRATKHQRVAGDDEGGIRGGLVRFGRRGDCGLASVTAVAAIIALTGGLIIGLVIESGASAPAVSSPARPLPTRTPASPEIGSAASSASPAATASATRAATPSSTPAEESTPLTAEPPPVSAGDRGTISIPAIGLRKRTTVFYRGSPPMHHPARTKSPSSRRRARSRFGPQC
jgi:hypothetical protein